ncbi:patatin-like phospholipase family protein [Veronia pacifica]|uniref:patatin-like phospholipase family protein n=1 Tax=Veronia pacifica TaxID=1080227 RepID=UPI000A50D502|nr:patatin family protein [Veronia pacifica]
MKDQKTKQYLTHHINPPIFPRGKRKIALVTQGGGQRGIYTAGVLDAFLDAGFDPFEMYIGSSAGALNVTAFLCRQPRFAHDFICDITTQEQFFNLFHFARQQQFMGLDWAMDQVLPDKPNGLNIHAGCEHVERNGKTALAAVTFADTLRPEYLPIFNEDWQQVLKATSAIPLLYPSPIEIGAHSYVDGGVGDSIPVKEAFSRGADIIVVIRTESTAFEKSLLKNRFFDSLISRVEDSVPSYLERINLDERLEKLDALQKELAQRFRQVTDRYTESTDDDDDSVWPKIRSAIVSSLLGNKDKKPLSERETIYRLHALSGRKLNADTIAMLVKHYQSYQDAVTFMVKPPKRVEIIEISPENALESSAMMSKPFQLEHDYQDGLKAGMTFLHSQGDRLNQLSRIEDSKCDLPENYLGDTR